MRISNLIFISFASFAAVSTLMAAPIDVTYTVTGTSGDFTLDFSFTNNETGTDQAVYYLGVSLDPALGLSNIVASPGPYSPDGTYADSSSGPSILYNDVWLDSTASNLTPGETLSGFDVQVLSATAPQAVPWFAFSTGNLPYTGSGNLSTDPYNPEFEGVAAPEPASGMMLLPAVIGAFMLFRLRKAMTSSRGR